MILLNTLSQDWIFPFPRSSIKIVFSFQRHQGLRKTAFLLWTYYTVCIQLRSFLTGSPDPFWEADPAEPHLSPGWWCEAGWELVLPLFSSVSGVRWWWGDHTTAAFSILLCMFFRAFPLIFLRLWALEPSRSLVFLFCFSYVYLLGCVQSWLQHPGSSLRPVGSPVVAHALSGSVACGVLVPQPGIEPKSPALQGGF